MGDIGFPGFAILALVEFVGEIKSLAD